MMAPAERMKMLRPRRRAGVYVSRPWSSRTPDRVPSDNGLQSRSPASIESANAMR